MSIKEKIIAARLIFAIIAFCVVFVLIAVFNILYTDATYPANITPATTPSSADSSASGVDVGGGGNGALSSLPQPEEAYEPVRLTFAGECTTGSMLGSSSYGTFNDILLTTGADYFLASLSDIFTNDDLTISGCNAVLSDRDSLEAAERDVPEWYLAPRAAAEVFVSGGIDVLSMECRRTSDYGDAGYSDTQSALEAAGLIWGNAGKAVYFEKSGISAAIYCHAANNENDKAQILAWIATASAAHDFVAVYANVSADSDSSYSPDDSRRAMFRSFIEAGADLTVGVGTSHIQPCEEWSGGYIVYSLGALLDGSTKYPEKYTAILGVELQVIDSQIQNIEYTLTPCFTYDQEHPWRPFAITSEYEPELSAVIDFMYGLRSSPLS